MTRLRLGRASLATWHTSGRLYRCIVTWLDKGLQQRHWPDAWQWGRRSMFLVRDPVSLGHAVTSCSLCNRMFSISQLLRSCDSGNITANDIVRILRILKKCVAFVASKRFWPFKFWICNKYDSRTVIVTDSDIFTWIPESASCPTHRIQD